VDHEGHFTIFAPTNEAFDAPKVYPQQEVSLLDRVSFHIARGLYKESLIQDESKVLTLLSKRKIRFNIYGDDKVNSIVLAICFADFR
jgi:transforming growth factor-beta-induced protein